jgi:hypothetical protein
MLIGGEKYKKKMKKKTHEQCCIVLYSIKQGLKAHLQSPSPTTSNHRHPSKKKLLQT